MYSLYDVFVRSRRFAKTFRKAGEADTPDFALDHLHWDFSAHYSF